MLSYARLKLFHTRLHCTPLTRWLKLTQLTKAHKRNALIQYWIFFPSHSLLKYSHSYDKWLSRSLLTFYLLSCTQLNALTLNWNPQTPMKRSHVYPGVFLGAHTNTIKMLSHTTDFSCSYKWYALIYHTVMHISVHFVSLLDRDMWVDFPCLCERCSRLILPLVKLPFE